MHEIGHSREAMAQIFASKIGELGKVDSIQTGDLSLVIRVEVEPNEVFSVLVSDTKS